MKNIFNRFKSLLFRIAVLAALIVQAVPSPAYAFSLNVVTPNRAWLRAKITYEYDKGITGLSDDIITFSDGWTKSDGWYYYSDPVESGQTVRFIEGLQLPTDWTSDQTDLDFAIIVTVEASEVADGEDGWDENSEVSYSESFDLWNSGYEHDENIYVQEGNISVTIKEYQLDEDGNEVEYENDKIVTPGQYVSKIVKFVVSGEKGALIELNPEKPVKTVTAANIDVDGKTVDAGTVLTYGITVKNPSPETETITITDTLDERLTLLDTGGGTLVSGSIGGQGGTIEWEVNVPGGESYTVYFIARTPETLEDGEGMIIPNTASADIVGETLQTNTVLTELGEVSALDRLLSAISRQTGDSSNLMLYAGIIIVVLAAALAVVIIRKRKKKG